MTHALGRVKVGQAGRGGRSDRAAFSLVELLMVITIIGFLVTISVVVGTTVMSSSRLRATQATVAKANELVMHRVDAFNRWADPATNSFLSDQTLTADSTLMGEAGNDLSRARILRKKQLFRAHFPQTFTEASAGGAFPDVDASWDNSDPDPSTISAELLYLMLTAGESFGVELGDVDFEASELGDTDQDGRTEIIDSWGRPLRFYRWPTRLIRPDGSNIDSNFLQVVANSIIRVLPSQNVNGSDPANPLTHDPDDPLGLLDPNSSSPPSTPPYAYTGNAAGFEAAYHTANTWHTPLVISAGRDGILGLNEPNDTSNFGYLAKPVNMSDPEAIFDNVSSKNLQSGA